MISTYEESLFTQVSDKSTRRVLIHGEKMMLVEFRFKQGGIGEPHKHENHDQIGYIAKGSFEVTVGPDKRILKQGDSYYAGKNVLHGVVALEEDSVIIDAFTPIREDFLK